MIRHYNTIGSRVRQCDRFGAKAARDDCNKNEDYWTLHCPNCGEPLAMIEIDDLRRRPGGGAALGVHEPRVQIL